MHSGVARKVGRGGAGEGMDGLVLVRLLAVRGACDTSDKFWSWTVRGFLRNLSIGNFCMRAVLLLLSTCKTTNMSLAALLDLSDLTTTSSPGLRTGSFTGGADLDW